MESIFNNGTLTVKPKGRVDTSNEEVAVLHEVINSVPDSNTFIHGDIHPKNIMVHDDEPIFIDMASLTYGHRIFDYAGIALTHILAKDYIKHLFGIETDTAQRLYNNMIKANFPGRTDEELERINRVIIGYAGIKYVLSPAINKAQNIEINDRVIAKAKEQIIPNANMLIGAIDF